MKPDITLERLQQLMRYDAETGHLIWLVNRRGPAKKGYIAGTKHSEGYIHTQVDGKLYYAHRLAWLMAHGEWPTYLIDHINGDRSDNRLCNLRQASKSQNAANLIKKEPLKGAYASKNKGRWTTRIQYLGESIYLGEFATKSEARAAYLTARKFYFGEYDSMQWERKS